MNIKKGFVKRDIMGQVVAVPTGAAAQDFHGMVKLNGSASFIWDCFAQGASAEEAVDALVARYEVDRAQAQADVRALAEQLKQAGIIE